MREPLHRLSAVQLAQMITQGEASPETLTRSFIDAIHEREKDVQAFAWFDIDRAIAAARELHLVSRRGPLHGLPVAVKDVIDTADITTSYGSPIYMTHRPLADAACVAALKDAGAFVLGKTVSTELANFTPGPTRNPRNLAHTPGGSSSGSAAAVAAHFAPLALGTQTAGSVIRPASFCGVVGYKPSPRVIPRSGVKQLSDTLDEVGVFARSVDDAAFAAAVLAGKPAWKDLPSQHVRMNKAPQLGWVTTSQRAHAAPSMLEALDRCGHRAVQRGAKQVEIVWPRVFDGLFEAQKTVQLFETARALGAELAYRRNDLSARLVAQLDEGRGISSHDYVMAMQLGRACVAAIDSLFAEAEVLLAPSSPGGAPVGLTSTGDPIFNRPWQLLGCPMINLPVPQAIGQAEGGLPLGITVLARPGEDAKLFGAAAWIEHSLNAG